MNTRELSSNGCAESQQLNDAQFLIAKAYRGVEYVDAHHSTPPQSGEENNLSYRGVPHTSNRHDSSPVERTAHTFTYRGQSYIH